jgi:hypothetical protein
MTNPRPTDTGTGTDPDQVTAQDPIGAIAPPKAARFGARALALSGFASAVGLVMANTDTPTPTSPTTLF